jgi:hypothetical protein
VLPGGHLGHLPAPPQCSRRVAEVSEDFGSVGRETAVDDVLDHARAEAGQQRERVIQVEMALRAAEIRIEELIARGRGGDDPGPEAAPDRGAGERR